VSKQEQMEAVNSIFKS